jgi:hypothetical protein
MLLSCPVQVITFCRQRKAGVLISLPPYWSLAALQSTSTSSPFPPRRILLLQKSLHRCWSGQHPIRPQVQRREAVRFPQSEPVSRLIYKILRLQLNCAYGYLPPLPNFSTIILDVPSSRLDIFYSIPYHYVPVLLPRDEFLSDLSQQNGLLLDSIFALASSYASFPLRQNYRESAVSRLNSVEPDQMDPFSSSSIQYMQSLLILVYLEFGNGNIPFACQLMSRACGFAQKQGWNALDAAQDNEGAEFTVNRDGPLIRRGVTGGPPLPHDDLRRRIRIVWWECWACDIVMSVTCRQPRNFHGVTVNVSLPSAPAIFREPGCPIVWVCIIMRKSLISTDP